MGASDMTTVSDDPYSNVLCVVCTRNFPRGVPWGGRYSSPWLRIAFGNGRYPRAVPRNYFWAVFAIFSGFCYF
jgi:hypothetical protein